jgi:hypothetical protein
MGQYLLVSPSYPYIWPLLPSRQVSIIYLFPTPAHSIFFLRPVENAPTNNNIASQQAIEAKFRSQPESSSEVILHFLFLCIQIKEKGAKQLHFISGTRYFKINIFPKAGG